MELSNQIEKKRTLGEKETFKYLGILESDTIEQMAINKKKIKRSKENEKGTRKQII